MAAIVADKADVTGRDLEETNVDSEAVAPEVVASRDTDLVFVVVAGTVDVKEGTDEEAITVLPVEGVKREIADTAVDVTVTPAVDGAVCEPLGVLTRTAPGGGETL